jgi:hypothetical protein
VYWIHIFPANILYIPPSPPCCSGHIYIFYAFHHLLHSISFREDSPTSSLQNSFVYKKYFFVPIGILD